MNLPVIFILRRAGGTNQCITSHGRLISITSGALSQRQVRSQNTLMKAKDELMLLWSERRVRETERLTLTVRLHQDYHFDTYIISHRKLKVNIALGLTQAQGSPSALNIFSQPLSYPELILHFSLQLQLFLDFD